MWTTADFLESCLASVLTSEVSSDLGMSPVVRRALEGKDTRTQVFIAAPHVKKVNRGMVCKILYIHTMEYYSYFKVQIRAVLIFLEIFPDSTVNWKRQKTEKYIKCHPIKTYAHSIL